MMKMMRCMMLMMMNKKKPFPHDILFLFFVSDATQDLCFSMALTQDWQCVEIYRLHTHKLAF